MSTYYGSIPSNLNTLKKGDVLLFNDQVSFQSPQIQQMFKEGYLTSYNDPKTGSAAGVMINSNYTPIGNLPAEILPTPNEIKDDLMTVKNNSLNQGKFQATDVNGNAYWTDINPAGNSDLATPAAVSNYDTRKAAILAEAEQRKSLLKQGLETQYSAIDTQIGSAIQNQKDIGGRTSGAMRRILAKAGGIDGTNASQVIATQESVLSNQIATLEKQRGDLKAKAYASYLAGDLADQKETRQAILDLEKQINETNQQRLDNLVKLMNLQNNQKQMDISTLNALSDLPEGQSVEIGGVVYKGLKKPTKDTQLVKNELTGDSQLIDLQTGDVISTIQGTGASAEQEMVVNMAKSYEDAGILPTDTLAQATAKLRNSNIYKQQTRLAGGGGGGSNSNLTDFEKATVEAARNVLTLEKAGASSADSYWNIVNQFSEAMGIDKNSADRLIINQIKTLKGEPVSQPVSIEDEIGSDFLGYSPYNQVIASPETTKKIGQENKANQLKEEANQLIAVIKSKSASSELKKQAKQKLATIPETFEGQTVWNRLLSGV